MGRRERGSGRSAELISGQTESGRVWEAVRRALGRLFSQATVRNFSHAQMTPPVTLRTSTATQSPAVVPGAAERDWKPDGKVREASAPQAWIGAREGNLLPSVSLAQDDAALPLPACRAMATIQTRACRVESTSLAWPFSSVRLPEIFLTLTDAPIRVESFPLLGPPGLVRLGIRPLTGWKVGELRCSALRLPCMAGPRIHWGGDAVLSRMALTRRGREAPPDIPFSLAFPAETLRLAQAANLPPDDVVLLGVYPGVPLLAVSRIVVLDEGRRLRLWLKPEILRGRNGGRLITLLMGRQTSSGKMLQAAL